MSIGRGLFLVRCQWSVVRCCRASTVTTDNGPLTTDKSELSYLPMHVVIFEGAHWRSFAPFALSRPVFMLPCGTGTLLDKQIRATRPTRVTLWVRPELEDYCRRNVLPTLPCPGDVNKPLDAEPALLMSGRTLHLSRYNFGDGEYVVLDDRPDGGDRVMRSAFVKSPGLSPEDVLQRSDRWLRLLELPGS